MSLILDALKRSEAEREQGRTAPPPAAPDDMQAYGRRNRSRVVFGGVVVMIALAAGALWLAPGENPDRVTGFAEPRKSQETPPVASPGPPSTRRMVATSVKEPVAGVLGERQMDAAGQRADRKPLAAGTGRLEATHPASVVDTPAQGLSGNAVSENADVEAGFPPSMDPVAREEDLVANVGAQGAATTPLDFRRLPYETRQAVGPLRLDVHVYDADPRRRFVMINGKTLGVGAEIKPGLAVDKIVREGVTLTWKGQTFLLTAGD